MVSNRKSCAVIGGGPAGLMVAEVLAQSGCAVTIYDQMPSLGRKFLMAGIGGLNLTHSEDFDSFVGRYRSDFPLREIIEAFGSDDLIDWCHSLGQETFIGSSGRVFPKAFKASPLLRSWIRRLDSLGVTILTRHRWTGWVGDVMTFETPKGETVVKADAVVLAVGGASWPRLGSDGAWREVVGQEGIETAKFKPSNCGFEIGWRKHVGSRFGGVPLKSIACRFNGESVSGEALITENGIEGGVIYALSAPLRDEIERSGFAVLQMDLKQGLSEADLSSKLSRSRSGDSLSNRLRKAGLLPAAIAVLREGVRPLPEASDELAAAIKAVPITLNHYSGIERAISTAGGICPDAVDERSMLRARPGTFVAGEMLDWEAPTGGYLLQGCFASGRWAANGVLDWLGTSSP